MLKFRKLACSLLVFAFVITIGTVAFAAEEPKEIHLEASSDQLKIINEIKGTDITVFDYYQKVYPEIIDQFDETQIMQYKAIKYPWNLLEDRSAKIGAGVSGSQIVQYSDYSLEGMSETVYNSSTDTPASMTIDSNILDGLGNVVASGTNFVWNKSSCSAYSTLQDPISGANYRAQGLHFITNQLGVVPSEVFQMTYSNWYKAK